MKAYRDLSRRMAARDDDLERSRNPQVVARQSDVSDLSFADQPPAHSGEDNEATDAAALDRGSDVLSTLSSEDAARLNALARMSREHGPARALERMDPKTRDSFTYYRMSVEGVRYLSPPIDARD
jgi:hypothetical protein